MYIMNIMLWIPCKKRAAKPGSFYEDNHVIFVFPFKHLFQSLRMHEMPRGVRWDAVVSVSSVFAPSNITIDNQGPHWGLWLCLWLIVRDISLTYIVSDLSNLFRQLRIYLWLLREFHWCLDFSVVDPSLVFGSFYVYPTIAKT